MGGNKTQRTRPSKIFLQSSDEGGERVGTAQTIDGCPRKQAGGGK